MVSLIRVINLDRREDRMLDFMENFKKTTFDKNLLRKFSAIDGSVVVQDIKNRNLQNDPIFNVLRALNTEIPKGELGCLLSHYFVLKEISDDANLKEEDFTLIVEDDVIFTEPDFTHVTNELNNFCKINTIPDFVYVSGRTTEYFIPKNLSFFKQESPHLYKRIGGIGYEWDRCASAYMCSKKGAKKIVQYVINYFKTLRKWTAIDNIYTSIKALSMYEFFPHVYYSNLDYKTDIQGAHILNKIHTSQL